VINVITRSGGGLGGVEGAVEGGTLGTVRARTTAGWGAEGRELLVSASRFRTDGVADLFFPELATSGGSGHAFNLDGDRCESVFLNGRLGGLRMQSLYGRRTKHVPTGSWGATFGDPRLETIDSRGWFDLSYDRSIGETKLSGRAYADHVSYEGTYPYEEGVNREFGRGTWVGGDLSALRALGKRHRLTVGTEYRINTNQEQKNWDEPDMVKSHDKRRTQQAAVYAQDEIRLSSVFTAIVGARGDWWTLGGTSVRPRAGLVYRSEHETAVKLLYGEAFRAADVYELFYQEDSSRPNPNLSPELLRTTEVVFEQYVRGGLRLTASAFTTGISDLIDQVSDEGVFHINRGKARARGVEVEAERRTSSGVLLRGSLVFEDAVDGTTHERLSNAPARLGTIQVAVPFANRKLTLASDTIYVGSRHTITDRVLDGYWLSNGVVTLKPRGERLYVQAGVYNLFNTRYADAVGSEFVQQAISQNGRTASAKVGVRF
jgi:iron complex outermembrane receptor protein